MFYYQNMVYRKLEFNLVYLCLHLNSCNNDELRFIYYMLTLQYLFYYLLKDLVYR